MPEVRILPPSWGHIVISKLNTPGVFSSLAFFWSFIAFSIFFQEPNWSYGGEDHMIEGDGDGDDTAALLVADEEEIPRLLAEDDHPTDTSTKGYDMFLI